MPAVFWPRMQTCSCAAPVEGGTLAGPRAPLGPPAVARHRLDLAAGWVRRGGLIAYPTEAVYGLGCDPMNGEAVRRLLELKARVEGKGLILIAAAWAQLEPYVHSLDPGRMAAIHATWPGPVTWLLPARSGTPHWLTGDHRTLAVRVTAHPLAAALCRRWGGPLVSTSANRAGRPPVRTALAVRRTFGARVDYLLVGPCGGGLRPSSVRDGQSGVVLR
jgi:L-threonylcarbamoyladenylate synthase